jgi:hypothetical protein
VSIRKRRIFHIVLILCHTFEQINRFTVAAVCRWRMMAGKATSKDVMFTCLISPPTGLLD